MDRLGKDVVHEICTNQVVVTLQACVKELVENCLDAGATRIEVRLRESGGELLEVTDNGRGISSHDYAKLATRHATSKIREYSDLNNSLSTFGFRGEALSAICAMGDMTVSTRTASCASASLLSYDRFGQLTSCVAAAREVGTTVSIRELFKRLPVRHKEFTRNAKAQVGASLRLIQSYAIAQSTVRFSVIAEKVRGHGAGRATLLCTSGTAQGWRQAAAAVLGDAALAEVKCLELQSQTGWAISGLLSTPSGGRRSKDCQLFFVNGRPIDGPKRIVKLINETYHQYNSRAYPLVILSFDASQALVDVNVTPDKKVVFLHNEEDLLVDLQQALTELYGSAVGEGGSVGASLSSFGIGAKRKANFKQAGSQECTGALDSVAACSFESTPPAVESRLQILATEATTPESGDSKAIVESVSCDAGPETTRKFKGSAQGTTEAAFSLGADNQGNGTTDELTSQAAADAQEILRPAGHPEELAASQSSRSWPRPLKRRASECSEELREEDDFQVLEFVEPEDEFQVSEFFTESQEGDLQVVGSGDPASPELLLENRDGPSTSLSAATSAQKRFLDLPAIGASFQTSVSLVGLRTALKLKRRRLAPAELHPGSEPGQPPASARSFPSAFSLTALRASSDKVPAASIEEVARFATEPSDSLKGTGTCKFDKGCFARMRVIGQFNLGFIIAALPSPSQEAYPAISKQDLACEQQLFIIDQHASDEKFRFEALNRESRIDQQPLVSAHQLQLSPAQEQLAESHLDIFRANGFELRRDEAKAPGRRLSLTTLPTCQGLVFNEKDVHELLYKLEESEVPGGQGAPLSMRGKGLLDLNGHRSLWSATAVPRPPKVWTLLASKACRYATMIGKALRVGEMEKILTNLSSLQQPWNCPHGRPTMRHLADADSARKAPRWAPPLGRELHR
eukprot:TRINITY_DN33252_c0_g1_i1.p1 TRINITY_DN33252_c0_g1~~TRINITY_DN33252_c0_g1_i1.p1  ORF type:complete len:915 (-),score=165.10 TRINITY_DN33252_c0_g1_i1:113-2857(-)